MTQNLPIKKPFAQFDYNPAMSDKPEIKLPTYAMSQFLIGGKKSMAIDELLYQMLCHTVESESFTLEFGSGVSTYAFLRSRFHTVIEQNVNYHKRNLATKEFKSMDLHLSEVGTNGWYMWTPMCTYDIILIDGPYGGNRYNGLPSIVQCCHKETVIYVDDVHRHRERVLAEVLADKLDRKVCYYGRFARLFPY